MLPLDKIKWKEETLDGGIVELRGGLSLHMAYRIAPGARSETAEVKRRIRLQIWREIYGDLTQPIMELQLYARRGAAYGADGDILKLCETINRLLEPPLDSSAPPSS